ncbi:MAG: SPOR domain-containing protein [Vicingaceae bacterium]|nr:SPOR domain-containing protein [Vicingaceae bacterium]
MNFKNYLSIILFIVVTVSVYGQDTIVKDSTTTNNVIVVMEEAIEDINKIYITTYKLYGYRIQIGSEISSTPARKIRAVFTQKYKNIPAYEIHQQPYFKVRVGDFKTKLEAIKFQKEISSEYPNSFIVKDEIEFKKGE